MPSLSPKASTLHGHSIPFGLKVHIDHFAPLIYGPLMFMHRCHQSGAVNLTIKSHGLISAPQYRSDGDLTACPRILNCCIVLGPKCNQ